MIILTDRSYSTDADAVKWATESRVADKGFDSREQRPVSHRRARLQNEAAAAAADGRRKGEAQDCPPFATFEYAEDSAASQLVELVGKVGELLYLLGLVLELRREWICMGLR